MSWLFTAVPYAMSPSICLNKRKSSPMAWMREKEPRVTVRWTTWPVEAFLILMRTSDPTTSSPTSWEYTVSSDCGSPSMASKTSPSSTRTPSKSWSIGPPGMTPFTSSVLSSTNPTVLFCSLPPCSASNAGACLCLSARTWSGMEPGPTRAP